MHTHPGTIQPTAGHNHRQTPQSIDHLPYNTMDAFADLGMRRAKKVEHMSLAERQKLQAQNDAGAGPNGSSTSVNSWSGLDLLSGGIGDYENKSASPPAPISVNGNAKDEIDDLFDVFNKPPPPTPPQSRPQASPQGSYGSSSQDGDSVRSGSETPGEETQAQRIARKRRERQQALERPSSPASFRERERHRLNDAPKTSSRTGSSRNSPSFPNEALDQSVAELVDMGFSADQARSALSQTSNGKDVRQAVDIIMEDAHRRSTGQSPLDRSQNTSRSHTPSSMNGSGDIGKLAQDLSAQLFTRANSLWASGRKNLAKVIEQANAQSFRDDSTPAWMRDSKKYMNGHQDDDEEAEGYGRPGQGSYGYDDDSEEEDSQHPGDQPTAPSRGTNEAMLLESHERPARQAHFATPSGTRDVPSAKTNKQQSPAWMSPSFRSPRAESPQAPAVTLQRKQVYEETTMYVSSSRRRTPQQSKPSTPEPQLRQQPSIAPKPAARPSPKPAMRARTQTPMPASSQWDKFRTMGTEKFKQGDYIEATALYTKAMKEVPADNLCMCILLANRAACHVKCGDAKEAVVDCDQGLKMIGPGLGENEKVLDKPLKDIWARLVTRKAEALEHLEKHAEALSTWKSLLDNGFSSSAALEGKRRCQQAVNGPQKTKPRTPRPSRPTSSQQSTSAQVSTTLQVVQEVNRKVEREEQEKDALYDKVDTAISSWKGGKEDNLRALLGSLEHVLWPEAGWKKVGLAELVMPNKVKIAYMKAVAKTHPDKVAQNATTEQKMVSEAVFVALNKAWDHFKTQNNIS